MATHPRQPQPMPPPEPTDISVTAVEVRGIHGQWGAITAGALAGFAAFLLLAVLGLAIGVTAGEPLTAEQIGIGAGIWWVIMLAATGIFGGWVTGRSARRDRDYMPFIYGTVVWVVGALIMLVLLTFGVGNIIGGVGGAIGQVIAGQPMVGQQIPPAQDIQVLGIATPTAWVLFGSMVIGLASTILGAWMGAPYRKDRNRRGRLRKA
jgi:hypothetical protein